MLRLFWKYRFHMQYEHERVEIALSILHFQTYSIDSGNDHENRSIVHLVVWTRQPIEFDSIK